MKVDKKNIIVPLLLVGSMNAILGFALGVNAFFIPFVKQAFHVTTAMSYLIMLATFSAYLVFGGVAGNILKKAGYKGGMVIALILMAVGFLIIVPSAKTVNFSLFLLALFINGLGQALLTGAYSTYVSIIGSPESAASRISFMGICAKIFYAAASFILAVFMDLSNVRITDIITPFYIIAAVMSVMGIIYYFSPLPEVKAIGEETETGEIQNSYSSTKTSVWQFPHLLLGVVAIFFTVGVEYLALGTINDYANILGLSSPHNYVWFVSFAMIVGYLVGIIYKSDAGIACIYHIRNYCEHNHSYIAFYYFYLPNTFIGARERFVVACYMALSYCRLRKVHQIGFCVIGNRDCGCGHYSVDLWVFCTTLFLSNGLCHRITGLPIYYVLCTVGK